MRIFKNSHLFFMIYIFMQDVKKIIQPSDKNENNRQTINNR